MNTTTTMINACEKCGKDTGASWKTLCRFCWKNQDPEVIRAHRQAKLDRKIARLRNGAATRERHAEPKLGEWRENSKDWAYVTQPNINTSAGRRFTKQRERVLNRYDAGLGLLREADKLRDKADWLEKSGVAVKGDADKRRQAERDYADTLYKIGSRVIDWCFGGGVITKVNKKTYTIQFDSGGKFTRDKSYIQVPKKA
jgi:hypothetical protein